MKALTALNHWQEWLTAETSPAALFPVTPIIHFPPESKICDCGGQRRVLKTRKKTFFTLNGPYLAHETITCCGNCGRTLGSPALLRLVQSRCQVGYDLLVHVGYALFLHHRNIKEVRSELAERHVHLSPSEISHLGRKFIAFLVMAHRRASPKIRELMATGGGYILHLDATHEGEAPALMTGMDGISQIVLGNVKLPSENADAIIPFLEKLKATYGIPQACVHDMGSGISKAISTVFPGIHDFICHFHFLRDIGKDFLEPAYQHLRRCLFRHGASTKIHSLAREAKQYLLAENIDSLAAAKAVKETLPPENTTLLPYIGSYGLALWCLQGKKSGNGYGFPFDRPLLTFADRLLTLSDCLPRLTHKLQHTCGQDRLLRHLQQLVSGITKDDVFQRATKELKWRIEVFDRLRQAMRIALPDGHKALNDNGDAKSISTIEKGVKRFRLELDTDPKLSNDLLVLKIAKQIDKYETKLFADPIKVTTQDGNSNVLFPQRTNNILEQFFRALRRGQRRKTGNNALSKTLQSMLADTPLVKNLENPVYFELLLDGEETLADCFARLQSDITTTDMSDLSEYVGRILPGFKPLLKSPTLPEKVENLLIAAQNVA